MQTDQLNVQADRLNTQAAQLNGRLNDTNKDNQYLRDQINVVLRKNRTQ
jgi:hypothetical protein